MPEQQDQKIVVDYAQVDVDEGLPFAKPMRRWRSACAWFFWATVSLMGFFPILALLLAVAALVCGVLTIVYMERMALAEAGPAYAIRQILLAILLSFFAFFGVWLMPPLVESDLAKWRIIEGRQRIVE
jgi:hypothetical protein